ncbi:hypothetical protein ACFL6Y_07665 [Elusimicrobiota bacterium]
MAKKKAAKKEKSIKKKKKIKKSSKRKVVKTKKKPKKKVKKQAAAAKKKSKKTKPAVKAEEVVEGTFLGKIEDFFSHVNAIALTLKKPLATGDTIRVKGHTTDLVEKVVSMQINRAPVANAKKGDSIGIEVSTRCRKGDKVYRI